MTGPCMSIRLLPAGLESALPSVLIWLYWCLFTVGHMQSCKDVFVLMLRLLLFMFLFDAHISGQ